MAKNLHQLIPSQGKELIKYTGKQVIEKLGEEAINNVVCSILCGGNVRNLTESLTQRRILILSSALFITYLKGYQHYPDFDRFINDIILADLSSKHVSVNEKQFLKWFLGITGKGVQNVIRKESDENLEMYLKGLDTNLFEIAKQVESDYGDVIAEIKIEDDNILLKWPSLLRIFLAVGTQTLAIRGSEKSIYGKLFEKLTLGALLSLLGFEYIDKSDTSKTNMVFWLSQREDKRESDATVLVKNGVGARFDIGFIGTGNSEISLDKVSRFERELEFGRQTHYVSTIILVDRIGAGSRIVEMADKINGNIVQMSMTYWVKEVAEILHAKCLLEHPILMMTQEESLSWVKAQMKKINLAAFV